MLELAHVKGRSVLGPREFWVAVPLIALASGCAQPRGLGLSDGPTAPVSARSEAAVSADDVAAAERMLLQAAAGAIDFQLYLPQTFALRDGTFDLVIHFHGDFGLVCRSADQARLTAAIVSVNRPGLSSAYEKPFFDADAFALLLNEATQALRDGGHVAPDAPLGRVYLSSFSAGFGALRAILRVPGYFTMIDGIILADSLYCGYDETSFEPQLDEGKMSDFRRFAREAAAGRKFMLVTHSAQVPDGYASTTETADDLIAWVGAERCPAEPDNGPDATPLVLTSRTVVAGFHVLGAAGAEGHDHGDHLRNLAAWYDLLALEMAGQ